MSYTEREARARENDYTMPDMMSVIIYNYYPSNLQQLNIQQLRKTASGWLQQPTSQPTIINCLNKFTWNGIKMNFVCLKKKLENTGRFVIDGRVSSWSGLKSIQWKAETSYPKRRIDKLKLVFFGMYFLCEV